MIVPFHDLDIAFYHILEEKPLSTSETEPYQIEEQAQM